jgi:hypothetical protein
MSWRQQTPPALRWSSPASDISNTDSPVNVIERLLVEQIDVLETMSSQL